MTTPRDTPSPARGRPQLHDDDELLTAALRAFATAGWDAMSMRSLSREFGLSHGALNQRFSSKERLFYAAVDHGFGGLVDAISAHLARWPAPATVRDQDRNGIKAFLLASAERPELVRLMNTLGISASDRLDYVFERYVEPTIAPLRQAVLSRGAGALAPLSTREIFFLIAHGAAAPFTLAGLSSRFDEADGPIDPEVYADHMAEVLLRTLGL